MSVRLIRVAPGCYRVERTPSTPRVKPPRLLNDRERVKRWANAVWRRYGDMFGDWAVAGMTEEERERFIGGGDRKLDRRAADSMHCGLSDAMQFVGVPDRLFDRVRRAVKRLAGM